MTRSAVRTPSRQLDASVLMVLGVVQKAGIAVTFVLAGLTFVNWIVPPLGERMPDFFRLMRANNAFLGVIASLGLLLLQPGRSANAARVGQALGAFIVLFAALLLASDFGLIGLGINTLFAADPLHKFPGRVSPEAASAYLLLGLVLVTLRARARPLTYMADFFAFTLCFTMGNFLASYILGMSHLFSIDPTNPFALQTYILLTVLLFVACSRRAEFGLFDVLLCRGIGGDFARLAAPLAMILPFAFAMGNASLKHGAALPSSALTARTTSLVSLAAFCLIVWLAMRGDRLERTMQEPILRDDLTRLYNRRGFCLLTTTALRLAQREDQPFFILFLDLDQLRRVNQTLGHATGSDFLCTVAGLLQQNFPSEAVIGRVGGDEFALAARGDPAGYRHLVAQFDQAAAEAETSAGEPFDITYSVGSAFSSRAGDDRLDSLLKKAERSMHEVKRRRQLTA